MQYRIALLLSAFILASCNTRPELSDAEAEKYNFIINGVERLIKGNKLREEARRFAVSELGATEQSMPAEAFDKAGFERNLKCLKGQRDQRVPSAEGIVFCGKKAPLPVPPPSPVPEGWNATDEKGIFWRWCKSGEGDCTDSKVIGDSSYALAQVWCKERACGDIYARVNLISENDVVVGWTNDTGYGDAGQVVQLTFSSLQPGWTTVRLTEMKFRN